MVDIDEVMLQSANFYSIIQSSNNFGDTDEKKRKFRGLLWVPRTTTVNCSDNNENGN